MSAVEYQFRLRLKDPAPAGRLIIECTFLKVMKALNTDHSPTTASGTETYTWDHENRLPAFAGPGTADDYSYEYDHRMRRVLRDESQASGSVTELSFSGGTSVQEADTSGTVQAELIRGSD